MKIHLPKTLLAAIAAALVTPAAYAYTLQVGEQTLTGNESINDTQSLTGDVTVTASGAYTLTLESEAVVNITGSLSIGENSGANPASLKVSDGTLTVTSGLTVNHGSTLELEETDTGTVNFSTGSLNLNGSTLKATTDSGGHTFNLGSLTVTGESNIEAFAPKGGGSGEQTSSSSVNTLSMIGLVVSNETDTLTLTTSGESAVDFGYYLVGNGDLVLNGSGSGTSTFNVSFAAGFNGNITVNNDKSGGECKTILKLTNTATSDDGEVFNSLTLSNSDTDSNSLGGIVQINMETAIFDTSGVKKRVTTVESLTVDGRGTIETVHNDLGDDYNATIKIEALSGTDAVLNLRSGSQTSNRVVFELGTPAAEETPNAEVPSYTGTINVVANATAGDDRRVGLVINNDTIAKGAIINLAEAEANTTADKNNQVDLAINSTNVTVRGITTTALPEDSNSSFSSTIVSGSLAADKSGAQSDGTVRTLTISTQRGDDFTANAAIKGNLDLVKMGEGKQTFSGDMSAFKQAVSVEGGELAFSKDAVLTITDLTVKSGATLTIGSPVPTRAADTATAPGVKVTHTGALEGGSTITGGLNLTETKTLTIDNISNDSTITLNGALILPTGGSITLAGDILDTLGGLAKGNKLNVFQGVTSLTLGDTDYTQVIEAAEATDLTKYFTFTGLEAGSYSLGYTGAADGGVVYIQKDVPEPTTATLSLLALAALAARRRRKN